DRGVLVDLSLALGGVDHGDADAVLHRPQRVEAFHFGDHGAFRVADHALQADERRVADRLRDVVVDLAAELLRDRHGTSSLSAGSEAKPENWASPPRSGALRGL